MRSSTLLLITIFLILSATGNAIEVEGDVWGVWTPDHNPYLVVGEVRVPRESTLTIEPGVFVDFQGHYKFIVDSLATLLAVGTETDSIYFTSDDTLTGWHGIRFIWADEGCQLSYCRIEYGKAQGPGSDDSGGGVHCTHSSITISNNTFRYNFATRNGGGLCLSDSSHATATDNLFASNTAYRGAGMRCIRFSLATVSGNLFTKNHGYDTAGGLSCSYSDAVVTSNVFEENSARFGGGINIRHCAPTIVNNLVENNQATFGGGMNCRYSQATIENNIISSNFADQGGGIYSGRSNLTIRDNVISNNSAIQGGAAYFENSSSYIEDNSIAFNSAEQRGGGFYWASSFESTIRNTILWGDIAPEGSEIYHSYGSNPTVTYCDVQGGWPGIGNIDADPIFMGPEKEDFYLRWRSRCIDTGDPFLTDPDGTRSDIGAFYFNQDVDGIIELYPHDTPIVIPPEGGDIIYDGWVFNFLGHPRSADIWMFAFVPETGQYGPIHLYENVRLPSDSLGMNHITEHVPGVAPAGEYVFVSYVGDYPTIIDSSYFYFTKSGSVGGVIAPWFEGEGWFKELSSAESNLPTDYALSQNYPNPFNATTTINYQLPADGYVKLEAYNTLGQKVATLADSKQQAGYRSVVWDASEFSSGIYFYKLTAGDFKETKKVMLIK